MSSIKARQEKIPTAKPIACPCVKHEIKGLGVLSEDCCALQTVPLTRTPSSVAIFVVESGCGENGQTLTLCYQFGFAKELKGGIKEKKAGAMTFRRYMRADAQ